PAPPAGSAPLTWTRAYRSDVGLPRGPHISRAPGRRSISVLAAMSIGQDFPHVVDGARAGAEWAVTALYRDLSSAVFRYLSAQAPSEAEDLASETWMDVARGLHRFRGDEQDFRRFVFAIARRRLIDFRRAM